jgi:DnaJ-class molecular chaperone
MSKLCPKCKGTKILRRTSRRKVSGWEYEIDCPYCDQTGSYVTYAARQLAGLNEVKEVPIWSPHFDQPPGVP